MAIVRLSVALQSACITPILTALDAGPGPAIIEIYNGTIPATAATAITSQTKLGTLTCSDPAGSVTDGMLTLSAITQDSSADNSGTATWARIKDSTGATVADIDITTTGGGGTLQMNNIAIVAGGPILISAFEFHIG